MVQGESPYIKLDDKIIFDLTELLSFDKTDDSNSTVTIDPSFNETILARSNNSFNQFITRVVADGLPKKLTQAIGVTYFDEDGDFADPKDSFKGILGSLTATWSYTKTDGKIKTLTINDLNKKLDPCQSPYQLTISADNVVIQSQYGLPAKRNYGSLKKVYTIRVHDAYKICYLRPASLEVYSASGSGKDTCTNTRNCKFIGGYNPENFILEEGFTNSVSTKFPTTGFNKAKFVLRMSNKQSDYIYWSSSPSLVSISNAIGSEGTVTLNSSVRPQLPLRVTLTAQTKPNIVSPSRTITYTFVINKWVRFLPNAQYKTNKILDEDGIFPAANACAGRDLGIISAAQAASYFYKPSELTNTPNAATAIDGNGFNGSNIWDYNIDNRASRDIDGTFYGEWGDLRNGYNMPDLHCTWTNQTYSGKTMWSTDGETGHVGWNKLDLDYCTPLCRQ